MTYSVEGSINRITHFFAQAEKTDYIGEAISQTEHALQCAYFAEQSGHSKEVIIASLLHDLGHFDHILAQHHMADLGVVYHEWIGAQHAYELRCSAKVALLIGYHVDAKRYLATKKPSYYERLSAASQQTLKYQGGCMSPLEMKTFEALPYFKEIIQVRVNDEKAKETNLKVPGLEHYRSILEEHCKEQHRPLPKEYSLTEFINAQWVENIKNYLQQQFNKIGVYYANEQ